MKVIDKNGNVLFEKEIQPVKKAKVSSLWVLHHAKGVKKNVTPKVMSKEEFFKTIIPQANGYV